MRILLVIILLSMSVPAQAFIEKRYLDKGKIIYEYPAEDDVMRVFVSPGFVTKIELPEEAELVLVGNNDLLKVEISSDKKSVIVNALTVEGKTNLIVDTASLHLNYEVMIGTEEKADYRVWIDEYKYFKSEQSGKTEE